MKESEFYGGSKAISISADVRIDRFQAWVWIVTADVASLAVQLPNATRLIPGYPVIQVVNDGATAFAIEDHDGGSLIASVAQDDVYTFALIDNGTVAGTWKWGNWTQDAGAPPTQLNFPWTLGGVDVGYAQEAWKFNFISDSWSQLGGSITEFLSGPMACNVGGIGVVLEAATEAKTFDPNVWADVTDGQFNREDAAGSREQVGDDKGYFYGAQRQTGTVDEVDHYDISGDVWTSVTVMLRDRHKAWVGSDEGSLHYVMAGATQVGVTHAGTVFNDQYDLVGDSHSSKTSLNQQRIDQAGAHNPFNGDLWIYAGKTASNGSFLDQVESYSTSADSWTVRTDHPNGTHTRAAATHVNENFNIYTVGGENATNPDGTYKHNPRNDTYAVQTDHGAASTNARNMGMATLSD